MIPLTRHCDGCTVCCKVMAVQELGKPYNCNCQYIRGSKCSIYNNKPPSCTTYECCWLAGETTVHTEKDGILYNLEQDEHGYWIEIYEVEKGRLTKAVINEGFRLTREFMTLQIGFPWPIRGIKIYRFGCRIGVDFKIKKPYARLHEDLNHLGRSYIALQANVFLFLGNRPDDCDVTEDAKYASNFWKELMQ